MGRHAKLHNLSRSHGQDHTICTLSGKHLMRFVHHEQQVRSPTGYSEARKTILFLTALTLSSPAVNKTLTKEQRYMRKTVTRITLFMIFVLICCSTPMAADGGTIPPLCWPGQNCGVGKRLVGSFVMTSTTK
jgi:hypothetical protein